MRLDLSDEEFLKLAIPSPTLVLETMSKREEALHRIPYKDRDYVKELDNG